MALYRCVTLKMPLLRKNINSTFTVCYLHIKIGPRLILQQRLFLLTAKPRNQIPREKKTKTKHVFLWIPVLNHPSDTKSGFCNYMK